MKYARTGLLIGLFCLPFAASAFSTPEADALLATCPTNNIQTDVQSRANVTINGNPVSYGGIVDTDPSNANRIFAPYDDTHFLVAEEHLNDVTALLTAYDVSGKEVVPKNWVVEKTHGDNSPFLCKRYYVLPTPEGQNILLNGNQLTLFVNKDQRFRFDKLNLPYVTVSISHSKIAAMISKVGFKGHPNDQKIPINQFTKASQSWWTDNTDKPVKITVDFN